MSDAALSWAVRLALDVQTCRDLLHGRPVDPARLDPKALASAKALRLVRLDMRAIDLFATPVDEIDDDDWHSWFVSMAREGQAA